jgi:alpha-galactosidase
MWRALTWLTAVMFGALPVLAGGYPAGASATTTAARVVAVRVVAVRVAAATVVAAKPPMGWNDWYADHCAVTQASILQAARALVSTGLAKKGYNTVVIDDCWMATKRTAKGFLAADPKTFPNGIAWLARKVHRLGLKLGIYESAGLATCKGRPGSYGHYAKDARTFASWGINFVKFDYCHLPAHSNPATLFTQFGKDLHAADPGIVYSQELPVKAATKPGSALFDELVKISSKTANMWRVTPDENPAVSAGKSIISHLTADLPLAGYAGAGHWNDLDLLVAGNRLFGYSLPWAENQMSVWAMEASPLIASTGLTGSSVSVKVGLEVLGNKRVIAIDQDGIQAKLAVRDGPVDILTKPGALLLANTSGKTETVSIKVTGGRLVNAWSGKGVALSKGVLTRTLPGYGVLLYQVVS